MIYGISPKWNDDIQQNLDTKSLWDFEYLNLAKIRNDYNVYGEGVNVYVLDTGIDATHNSFVNKSIKIKSFVDETISPPFDENGHGTWCCGKIVGDDVGIAPKCNLTSIKVFDSNGAGTSADLNKALTWILKQPNPHIINMSLGSTEYDKIQDGICKKLIKKGCIITAAMGNDATNKPEYPAALKDIIAVAALDANNKNADFSNWGRNVAVAAPGVSCTSTYILNQYRSLSGTSMATPIVSGILTLGWSYLLKKKLTNFQIRDILISALEKGANDLGDKGYDEHYGFGGICGTTFMLNLKQC